MTTLDGAAEPADGPIGYARTTVRLGEGFCSFLKDSYGKSRVGVRVLWGWGRMLDGDWPGVVALYATTTLLVTLVVGGARPASAQGPQGPGRLCVRVTVLSCLLSAPRLRVLK